MSKLFPSPSIHLPPDLCQVGNFNTIVNNTKKCRIDIAKVILCMSEELKLDPQNVKIPDTLPLIPVRDIVVFPYMVLPLFVGRDMSIKAIRGNLYCWNRGHDHADAQTPG